MPIFEQDDNDKSFLQLVDAEVSRLVQIGAMYHNSDFDGLGISYRGAVRYIYITCNNGICRVSSAGRDVRFRIADPDGHTKVAHHVLAEYWNPAARPE